MMTRMLFRVLTLFVVLLTLAVTALTAWAQSGSQGIISVTVVDASGGVVPGTTLLLVDLSTNDVRKASTRENGQYTFVNLSIGTYKLTASHEGYQSAAMEDVEVHAAVTTDVPMVLKVGASTELVVVSSSATPLVETSSNSIGSVVDLQMIEELPMTGRDLTAFSRMTAGYGCDKGGQGSWNGQPLFSQGSNIDGTIGQSSRMKIFGDAQPAVVPRLENIEEMTVQTDQLDLDQGFGQSTMQINFVSRRGGNNLHARVFENFHNGGLNANSYANNMLGRRRSKNIYNDFGGSVGGQILKDKLFYFGRFSMHYVPGGAPVTNSKMLSAAAQTGNFTYTYKDSSGNTQRNTVNVLSLAQAFSPSLPSSIHSTIAAQIAVFNSYAKQGTVNAGSNPNLANVTWDNNNTIKTFYPSFRLD